MAGLRVDPDRTLVRPHNLTRETEADAGALLSGGEKGYKDSFGHIFLNALAVIDDLNDRAAESIGLGDELNFWIID